MAIQKTARAKNGASIADNIIGKDAIVQTNNIYLKGNHTIQ